MAKITLYRDGRTIQVESTEYARVSRLYRDGWSRTATSRSSRGGRSGRAAMPSIAGSPFDAAVSEMQNRGVSPFLSTFGAYSGANDAGDRLGGTRRETYVDSGWFAMRGLPVIGPFAGHIRTEAEREKNPYEFDEDATDRLNGLDMRGDDYADARNIRFRHQAMHEVLNPMWTEENINKYFKATADQRMVWAEDDYELTAIRKVMELGATEEEANRIVDEWYKERAGNAPGMYVNDPTNPESPWYDPTLGGGGGGGGGGRMPAYIPPDRRTIEEMTRNSMVSLLGKIDDSNLNSVVDAYMRDHRRNWEGEPIDPNMTMLEEIRNSEDYKKIHQLRPDSANEATWVSNQRQAFIQGGGRETAAEDRSRELAAVGATASTRSAGASEFQEGFETGGFMQRFQRSAQSIAARMN